MALHDEVIDPVTGRTYVVSWDGSSRTALLGTDPHYTRQRQTATPDYTRGAIGDIGLRPSDVKCHVPVDWEW